MFLSARLKIDRANHHLRDLESTIGSLPRLNRASVQPDPKGRGNRIEHEIPGLSKIIENIALVTGDAVHNFRTALDHAWVESIKRVGLIPDDYTKFPLRSDADNLRSVLRGIKVHTANAALFDLMVSDIKAYKTGNEYLWALHHLDIADKHALLLPVISYSSVNNIRIQDSMGKVTEGSTWGGRYKDVIRIDIPNTHEVQYHGDRFTSIILDHGSIMKSVDIDELLQIFSRLTMDIVQLLEKVTEP